MPYHIGDTVRVRPGTPCPDAPELDIGGWQGRGIDLDWVDKPEEPTIGLAWDSVTLRGCAQELGKPGSSSIEWDLCSSPLRLH